MAPEVRGQILRLTGFFISPALHAQLATPERIMAWVRIQWHAKHVVKAAVPTPAPIQLEVEDDGETVEVYVDITRRVRDIQRFDRLTGNVHIPRDFARDATSDDIYDWISQRVQERAECIEGLHIDRGDYDHDEDNYSLHDLNNSDGIEEQLGEYFND